MTHPRAPKDIKEMIAAIPKPFTAAEAEQFRNAPCFVCGYNGAGYYSPSLHACAERAHARLDDTYILERRLALAVAMLEEIDGCLQAAYAEGLAEAKADRDGERLVDLIERRIVYSHAHIPEVLRALGSDTP